MKTATMRYLEAAQILATRCIEQAADPKPGDYAFLVSFVHKALREQVYVLERLREEEFAAQFNGKTLPPAPSSFYNVASVRVLKALQNYAIWTRSPEMITVYLVFGSLSQAFLDISADCRQIRSKLSWPTGETLDG